MCLVLSWKTGNREITQLLDSLSSGPWANTIMYTRWIQSIQADVTKVYWASPFLFSIHLIKPIEPSISGIGRLNKTTRTKVSRSSVYMHQKGSYGDREQPAVDRRGGKPGRLPSLSSVKLINFFLFFIFLYVFALVHLKI